jgi:hypothetical protein
MKTRLVLDVFVIRVKRKASDSDDFWIRTEILHWVLYVIFAVSNGNMVVI